MFLNRLFCLSVWTRLVWGPWGSAWPELQASVCACKLPANARPRAHAPSPEALAPVRGARRQRSSRSETAVCAVLTRAAPSVWRRYCQEQRMDCDGQRLFPKQVTPMKKALNQRVSAFTPSPAHAGVVCGCQQTESPRAALIIARSLNSNGTKAQGCPGLRRRARRACVQGGQAGGWWARRG